MQLERLFISTRSIFCITITCYLNVPKTHHSSDMTGSVTGESHGTQPSKVKATGESDGSDKTATEKAQETPNMSRSDSNKTPQGFLPPITVTTSEESEKTQAETSSPGPAAAPVATRKFKRSASSVPANLMVEETSTLGRRGRAQSYLTLYSNHSDLDGFLDSGEAASASPRRRRGEIRHYGTLERATSYSSLTARPHFRSANSTRPPPAPPCTTTHLDFCRHSVNPAGSRHTRAGTPRRNNPHPVGLHFQSPYNRDGKTFEVWNPDESSITNRLPQMCKHIEATNFTSGKMMLPETGYLPDIHQGSGGSVYRSSYQSPQKSRDYDGSLPTARFGSTHNRAAAVGVVPNVMSPRCIERRVKLHIPRGQKLESLV